MATNEAIMAAIKMGIPQRRTTTSLTAGTPVFWVRYVGTQDSGATLEVDATTGDLYATTDGTTADPYWLESGGTAGTIDTSDANGNTYGEVLDAMNASPYWEAYILSAIRADTSTNALYTLAETDMSTAAMMATGIFLYEDSQNVSFNAGFAISALEPRSAAREQGERYYSDDGCISVLEYASFTSTYGSGTSTIQVYSASQTAETLIYDLPGGATTAEEELGEVDPADPFISSKLGERLVVRVNNSAAMTAINAIVNGYSYPIGGARMVKGYTL